MTYRDRWIEINDRTHCGQEADERVLLVPAEGVADEGKGLAPHHVEEAPWVEAGQVAAVRAPPPVDEAQVRLAVPHAVVVLVDHLAGVVGVVGRVRVRHPLAPENVAAAALTAASSLSAGSARQQRLGE